MCQFAPNSFWSSRSRARTRRRDGRPSRGARRTGGTARASPACSRSTSALVHCSPGENFVQCIASGGVIQIGSSPRSSRWSSRSRSCAKPSCLAELQPDDHREMVDTRRPSDRSRMHRSASSEQRQHVLHADELVAQADGAQTGLLGDSAPAQRGQRVLTFTNSASGRRPRRSSREAEHDRNADRSARITPPGPIESPIGWRIP